MGRSGGKGACPRSRYAAMYGVSVLLMLSMPAAAEMTPQEPEVPVEVLQEFKRLDPFLDTVRIMDRKRIDKQAEVVLYQAAASQYEHKSAEGHGETGHMDEAFGAFVLAKNNRPKKLAVFWTMRNLDYTIKITEAVKSRIVLEGQGATYGDACMTWIFNLSPPNYAAKKIDTIDRGGCNIPEDLP